MARNLKRLFGAAVSVLFSAASFAQEAPFCHVSDIGYTRCTYYSLTTCQQAQVSQGGLCTTNGNRQRSTPQLQHYDVMESFRRGSEAGTRRRHAEEEHQAKLRLLEAQTTAAQSVARDDITIQPNNSYRATYACKADDGSVYISQIPIVGCVVTSLDFGP